MTDTTTVEAGLFSLDEENRLVRGRLIPWDEPTDPRHQHPALFRRGTITIPGDLSVLRANRDHQLTDPVAVFTLVEDNDGGADVELRIARTPEGDELIEQHKAGKYRRLSAEFRNLIKRGNEVVSGVLTGAAFVPEGAFQSAALFSLDPIEEAPEVAPATEEPQPEQPAEQQEENMSGTDVVTRPGSLPPALVEQQATQEQQVFTLMPEREDLFSLLKRVKEYGDPDAARELAKIGESNLFALSDVKISGANQLGTAAVQAGWIGHVWEGNAFERIIIPQMAHGDLTKLTWTGWKWNVKPAMATWAGNKAAITSNSPTATATTGSAQRYAGGHDLAREFYDFNETEAIEAYAAAMVESYAQLSDKYALAQVYAQSVTNGATVKDTYPTDVPAVIGKIVQGALKVISAGKGIPTVAVLPLALYATYVMTMRDATLEFLGTAASLESGTLAGLTVIPDPYAVLAADEVLVWAKPAARALELPGSPVRVNALDLVNGGVDNAFFGYIGVDIQRPEAIVRIADAAD
jgi:hypothetical protein